MTEGRQNRGKIEIRKKHEQGTERRGIPFPSKTRADLAHSPPLPYRWPAWMHMVAQGMRRDAEIEASG